MKFRVGVLRGGPSNEYDESLKSGGNILQILRENLYEKYEPIDILIDKSGTWYMHGKKVGITDLQKNIDIIWNALHGHFGEDGQVQRLLEQTGIPFTGSGAIASAQSGNKLTSREILEKKGIKVPAYLVISSLKKINENLLERGMEEMQEDYYVDDVTKKIFHTFCPYWILKPKINKENKNIFMAKTLQGLKDAVRESIKHGEDILVEEHIRGENTTSFVINEYRNTDLYATIPYDENQNQIHKKFGSVTMQKIEEIAKQVHNFLGLNHYSQVNFLVHKNGIIYVSDVKVLPQTIVDSTFEKVLHAHGSTMTEFVEHVLNSLIKKI